MLSINYKYNLNNDFSDTLEIMLILEVYIMDFPQIYF